MFEWKDEYKCGIKLIDDEHKKLFRIGQSLYDSIKGPDSIFYIDKVLDGIDELRDYTVYHFEDEERLMLLYEYPGYKNQKLVHDKFIEKIENFDIEKIEDNPEKEVLSLLDFIYTWIGDHILKMDFKINEYIQELKPSKILKNDNRKLI
ncbi:hemerythrin family protein [Clostridium sp. cel8]|jgi:hemerythrin|uniref:bacteriohemerythrin n=1 Tax=unclassified Clostridium TaxID=2614128 RepID=UPI0015F3F27A|nr:hemerythrin family protein [Clostridium sp. cel8]MBA5851872.1 hemerythrin family protein [Clostridium sp. cel8]